MIDVMKIQEILPHRYPFLLVDKITELKVGEVVRGYKNISISDHVFMGHFRSSYLSWSFDFRRYGANGWGLAFESMDAKVDPKVRLYILQVLMELNLEILFALEIDLIMKCK